MPFKLIHAKEMDAIPPRTADEENEYRRGYTDGFIAALTDIENLLSVPQINKEEAYESLWSHWQNELYDWIGRGGNFELPPYLSIRQETERIIKQKQENKECVGGFVYLLKSSNGYYKIGYTNNIKKRLHDIGIKVPFKIELIHKIKCSDARRLESELHSQFSSKRVNGEWFNLSQEDVNYIKLR